MSDLERWLLHVAMRGEKGRASAAGVLLTLAAVKRGADLKTSTNAGDK